MVKGYYTVLSKANPCLHYSLTAPTYIPGALGAVEAVAEALTSSMASTRV